MKNPFNSNTFNNNINDNRNVGSQQQAISIPQQMTLPKGGGAIRGIGEKFATNPLTGTATISIPIFTTPSRWDFYPKLSLTYDSGNGNGIFGLGWDISIPSISRKTEKELPKYWDEENSDTFILSGAEDLVPSLNEKDGWKPVIREEKNESGEYVILQYRSRIEGLFARIEKWKNKTKIDDVYWRTISKDNVTTIYGKNSEFRISDPDDESHIFKWLIEKSFDDKGNVIFYAYKQENHDSIDTSLLQEKNRLLNNKEFANRYLKSIKYCNKEPYNDKEKPEPQNYECLLEVIFDYGEHDLKNKISEETKKWSCRLDPFSTYRAGFEIRTYRLCFRVLMVHHFKELGDTPCLVRSTDFEYNKDNDTVAHITTFLASIKQAGYIREREDNYRKKSIPPIEFTYTRQRIDDNIHAVDQESMENLPVGLDGREYKWLDLNSEGLPGILTEQAGSWFYKQNLGNARFAPVQMIAPKPSLSDLQSGKQEIMDLADDGEKYLVQFGGPMQGFYRLNTEKNQWDPFIPFISPLNISWNDPNLKFIDLNGDGYADILISENDVFKMYLSKSTEGFSSSETIHKTVDEEKGPKLVFSDPTESIYLADISGDGQTDIVRIRNGEVCYWPNLGYGHFGDKIMMGNAPVYDHPDQFEQSRIRLADIDGSAITDIIYLGRDGVRFWLNQSGNSWSEEYKLASFPKTDNLSSVMVLDLLGSGTSCIVWSSPLPGDIGHQFQYIDLMGGEQQLTKQKQKPHLLESIKNNMGSETRLQYCSSTKFYLKDLDAGKPWITKLPFPVHVVERAETFDYLTYTKSVSLSEYHHGHYDRDDREFRGFGLVEQWDSESFEQFKHTGLFSEEIENVQDNEEGLHVPPVHTKTWFHTGFHTEGQIISKHFEKEYYSEKNEKWKDILKDDVILDDTNLSQEGLTFKEENEACRALKGQILRQEIYADDKSERFEHPYTVSERNYHLRMIQPILHGNRHAVFLQHERETADIYYERNPYDPRIHHTFTLQVDDYGNVKRQATVYYPRRRNEIGNINSQEKIYEEQLTMKAIVNITDYTQLIDTKDSWLIPIVWQSRSYEMDGRRLLLLLKGEDINYFQFTKIESIVSQLVDENSLLDFQEDFGVNENDEDKKPRARIFYWERKYFVDESGVKGDAGKIYTPVLVHNTETAVFPASYIAKPQIYDGQLTDEMLHEQCGYIKSSGQWWNPGIIRHYFDGENFFLPNISHLPDPLGSLNEGEYSEIIYDEKYKLVPVKFVDPYKNRRVVGLREESNNTNYRIDYRVLLPQEVVDLNDIHFQVIYDELGMVISSSIFGTEDDEERGDGNIITDHFKAFQEIHLSDILSSPQKYIQNATSFFYYNYNAWVNEKLPTYAISIHRERHLHESARAFPPPNQEAHFQFMINYSNGLGRELQRKLKVEDGIAWVQRPDGLFEEGYVMERWLTTGGTVYNNKGKPVKKYESYYSNVPYYETEKALKEFGVTSILHYDPLERVVRTDTPKGFFSSIVFDSWKQVSYDENDNIKESRFYDELINQNRPIETWKKEKGWSEERLEAEKEALKRTEEHANTPKVVYLNNLGQQFLESNWVEAQQIFTHRELDINGNTISITDPRQLVKNENRVVKVKNFVYKYDMQNRQIISESRDAGTNRILLNALNNPIRVRNAREFVIDTIYDKLQRPVQVHVRGGDLELDNIVEEIEYGESRIEPDQPDKMNIRGKPILHKDQAGIKEFVLYDINGQNIISATKLRREYKEEVNWNLANHAELLEEDENELPIIRTISGLFDALGRIILKEKSDGSTHYFNYHQSGLLRSVMVKIPKFSDEPREYVKNIHYNSRGQRESILYGNGTETTYQYERETFRLESIKTLRSVDSPGGKPIQDIAYVYDPIGNITHLIDYTHRKVFTNGDIVKPVSKYSYDSLYRLKHAEGRQHAVIMPNDYNNPDAFKQSRYLSFTALENNPNLLENYEQDYDYDIAGNLEKIKHSVFNNSSRSWTRIQTFADDSNRIKSSQIGQQLKHEYSFDSSGNMRELEKLKEIHYNYRNNISSAALTRHSETLTDSEYYVYDSTGMRVRKVTEHYVKINDEFKFLDIKEKIYLDGYEIKRNKRLDLETNSFKILLERISCHVMDEKKRVAIIHQWNIDEHNTETEDLEARKSHYQISNHLGACSLDIDEDEQIISYEEYYPFGGTSFVAGRSNASSLAIEVSIKDYRYSGKERDDNTGLYYYGVRYYIEWLGRWISCDPLETSDGINLFMYSQNNPILYGDSTGMQSAKSPENILGPNITEVVQRNLNLEKSSQPEPKDQPTLNEVVQRELNLNPPKPAPKYKAVSPRPVPYNELKKPDELTNYKQPTDADYSETLGAQYSWENMKTVAGDPILGLASGITILVTGDTDPKRHNTAFKQAKPASMGLYALGSAAAARAQFQLQMSMSLASSGTSPFGSAWGAPLGPSPSRVRIPELEPGSLPQININAIGGCKNCGDTTTAGYALLTKQGGLPRFALDIEGHPDLPGEAKLMSYRNIISEMRLRGHGAIGTVYNSNSDLETYHQILLVNDRSTIKFIDFQQEPGNQVVFGPNDAPSHFMMLPGRHIY